MESDSVLLKWKLNENLREINSSSLPVDRLDLPKRMIEKENTTLHLMSLHHDAISSFGGIRPEPVFGDLQRTRHSLPGVEANLLDKLSKQIMKEQNISGDYKWDYGTVCDKDLLQYTRSNANRDSCKSSSEKSCYTKRPSVSKPATSIVGNVTNNSPLPKPIQSLPGATFTGNRASPQVLPNSGIKQRSPDFGTNSTGSFQNLNGQPARNSFVPPTVSHNKQTSSNKRAKIESSGSSFQSATDILFENQQNQLFQSTGDASLIQRKCLGGRRVNSQFQPPYSRGTNESSTNQNEPVKQEKNGHTPDIPNVDPQMVELIEREIVDHGKKVYAEDIAGLTFAKEIIEEAVVLPLVRPDVFRGLRVPPKGLLLFGPPGTGKTLIAKMVASQSDSTFFSISASSLTSKYVGDGEKMVRALFAVARYRQPSVIFIDEVDSLLSARSSDEHESSRRMKTEFLVHLDGATSSETDKILLLGATNRPHELDDAARRRFTKRLYIPLPEACARKQIIEHLLTKERNSLSTEDIENLVSRTDGYSGADIDTLCREAAMRPIRDLKRNRDLRTIDFSEIRPINIHDFIRATKTVSPSVSQDDLEVYKVFNESYGTKVDDDF